MKKIQNISNSVVAVNFCLLKHYIDKINNNNVHTHYFTLLSFCIYRFTQISSLAIKADFKTPFNHS